MESGHRFDAQTLHSFIQAVFRQMGSEEQEAKLVADHLIAANLAGHDSHGIGMIPSYVRSWSQGHLRINHHAKIVKEAGAAVTLDGDRAFGQVAAHEAMALGIEKAHQHGIAAVALHNSHHIGRIGYWAEQCAAAGFVSIHFVSV
ncbi:MAG: hydroxycarboxylate dehydrogenase HcXB, partial [Escherichia coli]|nr:hydroxycarboxylate dehydrogenase HcXB [Escherichia coli]MBL0995380.1 hydroxycarboxylate dehydrogenase HcXB [Escherichia coli]MBL1010705.1 hydroxycarboxylate dehydrogenase HcXB [Escherichia coli]